MSRPGPLQPPLLVCPKCPGSVFFTFLRLEAAFVLLLALPLCLGVRCRGCVSVHPLVAALACARLSGLGFRVWVYGFRF